MKWWEYLYLGLTTIVMIYLIYRYADLTLRVRRQKRRYDLLLRGRGELNIEELLKAYSHDIDLSVRKIKTLESNYESLNGELKDNRGYLDTKIVELNSNTNTSFAGMLEEKINNLDEKINSLKANVDRRADGDFKKLNSDLNRLGSEMNTKMSNLDSGMSNKLNNLDEKYSSRMKAIDEKFTVSISDLDKKYTEEVTRIDSDRATQYKKINERHEFDTASLKKLDEENYNKLIDFINKQDKAIDENLGFAIQQVSLHKYNALRNQSGDLSFTMVLLDRNKNGLMLTSINGRDASYTYSKEIVNGRCVSDTSPEEEKALEMLVKNN